MRKPTFWFQTWSYTNQAVQLQKMARGLKFRIEIVEELYYLCSENKGSDQSLFFAYAKGWFSHDTIIYILTALQDNGTAKRASLTPLGLMSVNKTPYTLCAENHDQ